MFEAHPARSPGVPTGYALIAAILLLDVAFLYLIFNRPITLLTFLFGLFTFLSLPAVAFLAYWTAALTRARYLLSADWLRIEWGPFLHTVPLHTIQSVDPIAPGSRLRDFNGLRWPGYLLGRGHLDSDDDASKDAGDHSSLPVYFFATQAPAGTLFVRASGDLYGLSPQEPATFHNALQEAMAEAVGEHEAAGEKVAVSKYNGWTGWPIWQDRTARALLILPLLVNGVLFALLAGLFPRIPSPVPLRMDGTGAVLLSGPSVRLFLPPLFALLTWLFNAAAGLLFYHHRREQAVAYLLWGAALVVQFAAWGALLLLLP